VRDFGITYKDRSKFYNKVLLYIFALFLLALVVYYSSNFIHFICHVFVGTYTYLSNLAGTYVKSRVLYEIPERLPYPTLNSTTDIIEAACNFVD
jgi:hypothetical protein